MKGRLQQIVTSVTCALHQYQRPLLVLAYSAALAALGWLWMAHGWQWGLIYVTAFLIVHLVYAVSIEIVESEGDE